MFSIINRFKLCDTKRKNEHSKKFFGLYNNSLFEKNMKIREEIREEVKKNMILWCNKMTKSDTQLKIKDFDFYNKNEKEKEKEKEKDLVYSSDNYFLQSIVVCGFVFAIGFYIYRK